MQKPNN